MYTYLIGWSQQNKWYYGVRFSSKCKPEDLWTSYFTSSKYVHRFTKQYGDPDVIEIRKLFEDSESARQWETKVLRRLNVIHDDRWLNRTNNIAIRNGCRVYGSSWNKGMSTPRTKDSIEKQRNTMLGKKRGPYNYNHDVKSTAVTFRGKDYPSIDAARKDTGASFYTIKKHLPFELLAPGPVS
jgi:hypothetical protein